MTKYFAKDSVFSFSQAFLPSCSCFPFLLRIDKNSETPVLRIDLMWPYYGQWPPCFTQLQHCRWDASAKNKHHPVSEARAVFLQWLLAWWTSLSLVMTLHSNSSRVLGAHVSCPVIFDSSRPHGLQHTKPPCPSPSPRVCSNSSSLSQWRYLTISSSVAPFFSCRQSFPAPGSFPMNWLFITGGQSLGASASASVLSMNIQDWYPLGWTG